MSEWKTIDSAPRDGDFILFGGYTEEWKEPFSGEIEPSLPFVTIVFFEPTKGWRVDGKKTNIPAKGENYKFKGHWSCAATGEKICEVDGHYAAMCVWFTHWMPLPTPTKPPEAA